MPPKKRKTTAKAPSEPIQGAPPTSTRAGATGNVAKGLLSCPVELQTEILGYFPAVQNTTAFRDSQSPILHSIFLERTDVLRTLSQVSLDYRRVFLPLLYETVNVCCGRHTKSESIQTAFYKYLGDTLRRKMEGLAANPELANCVREVNVVLTRYQSGELIPLFSSTIANFQNLHTLHVLHAHTQMTTAIKTGFSGVSLPQIRQVIIPGYGHEILRACPKVKVVWSHWRDDASKIVSVIAKHCKEVEEIRNMSFYGDNTLKRLVKAAPNLKTIGLTEIDFNKDGELDSSLKEYLPKFPKLCEIIIRTDQEVEGDKSEKRRKCIRGAKAFLKSLPRTERKRLRIWNVRNPDSESDGWKGTYTSVDLDD